MLFSKRLCSMGRFGITCVTCNQFLVILYTIIDINRIKDTIIVLFLTSYCFSSHKMIFNLLINNDL